MSYRVYRNGVLINSNATSPFVDSGLTNGQNYSYQVSEVNVVGEGPKAGPVIGTPYDNTGTGPSGIPINLAPIAGWPTLLFSDDFNTSISTGSFPGATGGAWTGYPVTYPDTSGYGRYDMARVLSVHDSMLDFHLRKVDGFFRVAAPWPSIMGQGRTNMRVEYCFKADPTVGFKTSWLTWPTSENWPRDGEIDFPEGDFHRTIEAYMHRQGATVGSDQDYRSTSATYTSWHRAAFEWEAGVRCAFYLDGVMLGSPITSRVPNTPMRLVIQTETWLGQGAPPEGANGHLYLDWIVARGK